MSQQPFFKSVEEFVTFSGGDHAIRKVLIANNGIGAIKAIRSIRRWSFETFGNERMIQFVVMATPEDMRANAEYIRMADEVVDVPGGSNNNNYANITLICEIAQRNCVDAVMPMWGHASENPALPLSLSKLPHRVTFVGPAPEPMHALGDKIGSTIIAQSAGVPVIAWNGDNLRVDYKTEGIPQSIYDQANVTTAEECLRCCERIGFPVMIKASEGGGGKGIRKVTRSEDVLTSFRQVQGEIPGSPIFVMKMAGHARHLEVQLLADKYGDAIALSGRDCSVQRRHQKIIEEGPPTAASPTIFKQMERAAVSLAKTVGYCNCGTVEYLFMEETGDFAFLELNPRLQVEHPVTENILGLNLPACQIQVAMGIPLHRIGNIRKLYGRHPMGKDTIDFDYAERVAPPRHCIAVRITAENPDASFQPTSGNIRELSFRSAIDVWGYFSIDSSGLIHEFADSQFGHIFASGPDRESARRAMLMALKELQIRGEIRTTVEYIMKLMQSTDFVENKIDTAWLDARIVRHKELAAEESLLFCPPPILIATCGAALEGYKHFQSKGVEFIEMLKVGQIPSKDTLAPIVPIDLIFENIKYRTRCIQNGPSGVRVECNGSKQDISIRTLADGGYLLNVNGKNHLVYSVNESGGLRMILDGNTCIFTPEYDPTRLTSTVAGKIARLLVADGSHVMAGDPYVEIEVMKMYMPLKAFEAGTVHFQMSEGAALVPGSVIAISKLDDPDRVVQAVEYTGSLVSNECVLETETMSSVPPHLAMRESLKQLDKVMAGFPVSDDAIDEAFASYLSSFHDKLLPAFELEEVMSVLRGRIDQSLTNTILTANSDYKTAVSSGNTTIEFPSGKILLALHEFGQALPSQARTAFHNQVISVWTCAEHYLYTPAVRALASLLQLLEKYLNVEKLFDDMSFTDVVSQLRKEHSASLDKVLELCRSHINYKSKNFLVMKVLDEMKQLPVLAVIQRPSVPIGVPIRNEITLRNLKGRLTEMSKLRQGAYSQVGFGANLVLMKQYTLKPEQRRQKLHDAITHSLTSGEPAGVGERLSQMKTFIDSNLFMRDLLLEALRQDKDYQIATLELYLYRTYQTTHRLSNLETGSALTDDQSDASSAWIKFQFMTKQIEALGESGSISASKGMERNLSYNELASLSRSLSGTANGQSSPGEKQSSLHRRNNSDPLAHPLVLGIRVGVIAAIESVDELHRLFPLLAAKIPVHSGPTEGFDKINAIHVIIMQPIVNGTDDDTSANLSAFLGTQMEDLKTRGIRRVTFLTGKHSVSTVSIFTFRIRNEFSEDRLYRHIEAPHAFHLDLPRLSNFSVTMDGVQTSSGNVFMYKATPKTGKGFTRYFSRLVCFSADINNSESLFVEGLDHLGLVIGQVEANRGNALRSSAANHVFLSIVAPEAVIQPETYEIELRRICAKYWHKMVRLAISTVEVKISCKLNADADPLYVYLVATNPTGFVLKIDRYYEAFVDGKHIFKAIGNHVGPLDGLSIDSPYPLTQKFEQQRAEALASSDTLYVYDWPFLFESATQKLWETHAKDRTSHHTDIPEVVFSCRELIICNNNTSASGEFEPLAPGWTAQQAESGVLVPLDREAGQNDVGMVAWLAFFRTPECPNGREVVIICNDITHQAGSFGTKEDVLFFKASEYARLRGIPRLFLAANSGARIGMAQSLKSKFQVCWTDERDPSKGFKYLYLNKDTYDEMLQKANGIVKALPVICRPLIVAGEDEERYVITDIIGEEPDLGVENLMGSGLIAGETARAYDEIFTLTMVVGRTVGIGAYLVRLGQRTIQKTRNSPIILTGYQALNKLMGREIYTTNDQLGGPMIMFPNGVSHMLADTHMESVNGALSWLSFIPAVKGGSLPIRDIYGVDNVDRLVKFAPTKGLTYDPRLLLCGDTVDSVWQSGFFDKNSFVEALGGWAKTVVVGRGHLGGIPMGVIVTENRTAEATKPADPADMTSQEKLVQQAGGVWFPDSAYKTAQALKDFNREGLPCIIFANWRGFSGGQRDMFDEVLKFGSMIVDALVAYQQPLFVYIPPFAELRGGAWVVVDSTINADVMEFYAAEDARGGVLEAAGAASIKFRDRDIIATSHRIDPTLVQLDDMLKAVKEGDEKQKKEIERQIKQREKMLFGVYQQVAVHFADLHDTPGRMQSKGVIRRQVEWAQSRTFFYWRLKRRLLEFDVANRCASQNSKSQHHMKAGLRKELIADLQKWFITKSGGVEAWEDDKRCVQWMLDNDSQVQEFINNKHSILFASRLQEQIESLTSMGGTNALKNALASVSEDQKKALLAALQV